VGTVQVVEFMRQGNPPKKAAELAIRRIIEFYPSYVGALVAVNAAGEHGAAGYGWTFEYAVRDTSMKDVTVYRVEPITLQHS
jgi:N4-(beta-N-acetylglucosaminyl)-L-asparaginase